MVKAFITGGTGFVGGHLIERILSDTSWEVVSLERLPYGRGVRDPRVRTVYHDLLAPLGDMALREMDGADIVVHAAAEVSAARSMADPLKSIRASVLGTYNVLEAARKAKPGRLVLISSGEVLGPTVYGQEASESSPMRPNNPYASGKAAAELLARSYSISFDVPVTTVRAMNMFGPRAPLDRFLPKVVARLLRGEEVVCADGYRNWLPVEAFAAAVLDSLALPLVDTLHVVGPGRSNRDLVELTAAALGRPVRIKREVVEDGGRCVLKPSSFFRYEENGFSSSFMDAARWYAS